MGGGFFRVTITESDYNSTEYTTVVRATSKNQAIVIGAALAGAEKTRREWHRTDRDPGSEIMMSPASRLEPIEVHEYYDHKDEVTVTDFHTRYGK